MDMLQLVFAFVNAPLFATFLLGMFWRRATGHGAFFGLLSGTAAAAVHHGLTLPHGAMPGIKGGCLGATLQTYPSEMAQNFWTAIVAWTACFVATIAISLAHPSGTRRTSQLGGLVYSLTPRLTDGDSRVVQAARHTRHRRARAHADAQHSSSGDRAMNLDLRYPIGLHVHDR